MKYKFCPYCQSLIEEDGHCSNRKCVMGNKRKATIEQIQYIEDLCIKLKIDISEKDPKKLSKEKASALIGKLKKRLEESWCDED